MKKTLPFCAGARLFAGPMGPMGLMSLITLIALLITSSATAHANSFGTAETAASCTCVPAWTMVPAEIVRRLVKPANGARIMRSPMSARASAAAARALATAACCWSSWARVAKPRSNRFLIRPYCWCASSSDERAPASAAVC